MNHELIKSAMSKKELSKFLVYQANQKEFHICLEAKGKFLRWCSYYPPTMDVRYPRVITRIKEIPLDKKPRNKIFDEGSYTITKSDTKESIESKILEGIKKKSFSFILNGKKLKGRFAIKKASNGTLLQKFKDKFATEEDVLSGDLARTISTMVPNYDETKVNLNRPLKVTPKTKSKTEVPSVELKPIDEITPDKEIGGVHYHFAYYTSKNEPDICLVTGEKGEVVVLKKEKDKWVMQSQLPRTMLKKGKQFSEHAGALYE